MKPDRGALRIEVFLSEAGCGSPQDRGVFE